MDVVASTALLRTPRMRASCSGKAMPKGNAVDPSVEQAQEGISLSLCDAVVDNHCKNDHCAV